MSKDLHLRKAVERELSWDTHVDDGDITIAVEEGVVTLTGTVRSWAQRIAAQAAAHRVAGVLDVANEIEVKIAQSDRSDTETARAVREALKWSVFVPDTRISSTVSGGLVTLEGNVDYLTQREDAEEAVRDLNGVRGVFNKIQVVPPRSTVESELRGAIADALERRLERELGRIHLDVRDGHVIVSGSVPTWSEHQAALGAAKGTVGVRSVEDHLRIDPNVS